MSQDEAPLRRDDDLRRLRSEVNEHRLQIVTTHNLTQQLAENQKELSSDLKDLAVSLSNSEKELVKSLSKLDKKFTVFITALIVSVGFGDKLASLLIGLI